jgi:hypothetical protein
MDSTTGPPPLYQLQADDFAFLGAFVFLGIFYAFHEVIWAKPDPYHYLWFEKPQGDGTVKEANTRDIGEKLEQTVSGNLSKVLSFLTYL